MEKHPNADRLDCVQVKGWNVVTGKGAFQPGDLAVYIPIDSVLPRDLETYLFPPDSKVVLHNSRVKTIKLRGAISQGMLIDLKTAHKFSVPMSGCPEGADLSANLGIVKYEPPAKDMPAGLQFQHNTPEYNNPLFSKYTDIEHLKNHMGTILDGDPVYITEKLHGTSARYGILPFTPACFWDRVKRFFGFAPRFQFVYGSRNKQLQGRSPKKNFYKEGLYFKAAQKYNLEMKLHPGEIVYGEIVGEGIQKGYSYGYRGDDRGFFAYDVKVDGQYLSPAQFEEFCFDRSIPTVPVLYNGPFSLAGVEQFVHGPSTLIGQPIKEGIIIKPHLDRVSYFGRVVLKWVSPDFLLTDPTDFH